MKKITQRDAMKVARKIARIRDNYASIVDAKASEFFGEEFSTSWSIFGMGYYTTRKNGKKLTKEQSSYIRGLSDAFAEAVL